MTKKEKKKSDILLTKTSPYLVSKNQSANKIFHELPAFSKKKKYENAL